ncbi:MAG: hypothetical protein HY000_19450 [Planctomycetes bacterium]|nr:hypothetical protein [Planctomycetota bacterium]
MNRRELVLAALAASGGATHTPVQIQKLLFLLERTVPQHVGGQKFSFQAFDYGPFDPSVYKEIEQLEKTGLARIDRTQYPSMKTFALTLTGQEQGEIALQQLPADVQDYFRRVSQWVRSLSFANLVSAIYHAYPDMKVNSVFNG